jgi:hypothetical protein
MHFSVKNILKSNRKYTFCVVRCVFVIIIIILCSQKVTYDLNITNSLVN